MTHYFKPFLTAVLCALVAAGAAWCQAPKDTDVVAEVYGQKITRGALVSELVARHGQEVLESLIEATAIEQYAKQNNIKVADDEVQKRVKTTQDGIDAQAKMNGGDFSLWLIGQGLTMDAFTEQIRIQALLEAAVKDKVKVEDAEVGKFYEDNKSKMANEEAVYSAYIVVGTSDEAEKLRGRIVGGELKWDDAAKQFSIDPYGRDNGGLIGWIKRGEDAMRKAVFALQKDEEISPVVSTEAGFAIFKRLKYRTGGIPAFDEVKADLKEGIYRQKVAEKVRALRGYIMQMGDIQRLVKFGAAPAATPALAAPPK
jgi:parvulin-like peptidyl-prolyl isomerase